MILWKNTAILVQENADNKKENELKNFKKSLKIFLVKLTAYLFLHFTLYLNSQS